jgi:hypothetical protein
LVILDCRAFANRDSRHGKDRAQFRSRRGATPEESIDNMLTLDAILQSARGGSTVEIPANH